MATRESIMKYIRANDSRADNVMIYSGRSYRYFYFGCDSLDRPSIVSRFADTSVMVNRLNALTPDQWLAEFKAKADSSTP